jgi:hypothetical protein
MRGPYCLFVSMLGAILLSACQTPRDDKPKASAEKASSESRRADTWERTKECAAQAERAAKGAGWDKNPEVMGWENHYSSKYERCFVGVSWVQPSGETTELYDAFERKNLAMCNLTGGSSSTIVDAETQTRMVPVSDSVCQQFIDDRMAH